MQTKLTAGIVLLAAVLVTTAVGASGLDLHWLWHDRCAACHGHAGDFSRKFLSVSNGELRGRHHVRDLRRFLKNHYLAGREVDAVYNMLLAQANSKTRFRDECGSCHETAAKFVRATLTLHDGVLYTRASGRTVRSFLDYHRNLEPNDIDFFVRLLTRVAHEVYRP